MGTKRILNDWLTGYLEYVQDTEPPKSFHTWAGISMVAGALQRRVWTRYGHQFIYPNLYIILVGKSGGARKGTAMGIGRDILDEVPAIEVVAESITPEKLINRLAELSGRSSFNVRVNTNDGTIDRAQAQAAITCFSEELSVFLEQKDIRFLSHLTDFYDSRDEWRYETKNRGEDHIHGICFNLLGATAPDWMQSMLPQEAVGGGFTSRCIFIFEERKGKSVPEEPYTEWHVQRRTELINDLNIISNLSGPYQLSSEARAKYNEWYRTEDANIAKGKYPIDDPRFAGYCERRANHIRKLMMVCCASRSNQSVIEEVDFARALNLLLTAEKKMPKAFGGLGRSAYSEAVELVLDYLIVHGECTRSQLMRQYYRDIDSGTLKIVEEVMEHMKIVKIRHDTSRNEVIYKLIK